MRHALRVTGMVLMAVAMAAPVAWPHPASAASSLPAGAPRARHAQAPRSPQDEGGRLRPAEFAELVDAYAVVQAQKILGLDNEQYGQFVANFRALQAVRRKYAAERLRAVHELNRLTRRGAADALLRERLSALDTLDTTASTEERRAVEAVESSLTVTQRARFRVFEDLMERRKFELLARVRGRAR